MKTILSIAFTILLAYIAGSQNTVNSMKDLDYGVEVKTLKVKGDISLAYTDEGAGDETIVFIHGL
nr:hypothetical protein [Saprospiraceae bacterium]